jgi:glycosyltransferase involved in cell wall biosynthesis
MKIAFIFAYEGEYWSTPISIVNEFKKRGWETEIISIGSNSKAYYHDNQLKKWIESKPTPDIVMFLDWGRFDSPYLDKKHIPKAFWIQESGDDPQNFERNYPKANRFHLTLTPDHDSYLEYKKRGINAIWWTHFADIQIHKPQEVPVKYIAVTSRGLGGSQFLDTITEHAEGAIANQGGWQGEEHSKFLCSGLLVVQNSRWGEITRRIFEAMACGVMVLTDRLNDSKKLYELFEDKIEIVFYDDIVDCLNKINHYANNTEEREKIALAGMKKVLDYHTQIQRVDKILDEEWTNYLSASES